MRTIDTHHTNECNKAITLEASERNENGVTREYIVTLPVPPGGGYGSEVCIPFQYGPIKEVGTNGVTLELLLAIVRDQLEGYQTSKFANEFNEAALGYVKLAAEKLEERTRIRMARGVEGTHQV